MCKIVQLIEITAFYEMTVGNVSLPAFTNIQTHTQKQKTIKLIMSSQRVLFCLNWSNLGVNKTWI